MDSSVPALQQQPSSPHRIGLPTVRVASTTPFTERTPLRTLELNRDMVGTSRGSSENTTRLRWIGHQGSSRHRRDGGAFEAWDGGP